MKLSKAITKYEAMRKILQTQNDYEAVMVIDEVIADLKYILNQRKRNKKWEH